MKLEIKKLGEIDYSNPAELNVLIEEGVDAGGASLEGKTLTLKWPAEGAEQDNMVFYHYYIDGFEFDPTVKIASLLFKHITNEHLIQVLPKS